jgi:hypothetical protein
MYGLRKSHLIPHFRTFGCLVACSPPQSKKGPSARSRREAQIKLRSSTRPSSPHDRVGPHPQTLAWPSLRLILSSSSPTFRAPSFSSAPAATHRRTGCTAHRRRGRLPLAHCPQTTVAPAAPHHLLTPPRDLAEKLGWLTTDLAASRRPSPPLPIQDAAHLPASPLSRTPPISPPLPVQDTAHRLLQSFK